MSTLILSDGRMGHLNQSLALVKYLDMPYDVVSVTFKTRWYKLLSYLLDRLGIYTDKLFTVKIDKVYDSVISTGSTTYYATKVLAKKMQAKSIVMMLPRGYRYDYDVIFAQRHDVPPKQKNIRVIPANFSYVEPKGLYRATKKSVGIVIGGENKIFHLSKEKLEKQLDFIKQYYEGCEIAISTSPRTSKEIEPVIKAYAFDYEVIYAQNPVNPIPDFLSQCETVFITQDSTSMISEAVSYGESNVVILPLESRKENKFARFVKDLEEEGYLHLFDGTIQNKNKKINFRDYLGGLVL